MFDPRKKYDQQEEVKFVNTLRKVKNPQRVRNFTETIEEAKQIVPYP